MDILNYDLAQSTLHHHNKFDENDKILSELKFKSCN